LSGWRSGGSNGNNFSAPPQAPETKIAAQGLFGLGGDLCFQRSFDNFAYEPGSFVSEQDYP
jgi:hypothetical protein